MIGRFQALLPFVVHRPEGEESSSLDGERDGYRFRVWPLMQAIVEPDQLGGLSDLPVADAMEGVRPRPTPKVARQFEVNGIPAMPANLIVIDFLKDEFDRSYAASDPPFELGFQIANDVLSRVRTMLRAPGIHALIPSRTPARIDYMNDDGTPLEAAPLGGDPATLPARSRVQAAWGMSFSVLLDASWREAANLPDEFVQRSWDGLLLDAFDLLPSIPPAIVVAFAALESFVDWTLDELAAAGTIDAALYRWIVDRDDLAKRPSTKEQFDVLLQALGGKSLKDDNDLWRSFVELREVRNEVVHAGEARLRGVVIDEAKAAELVVAASNIIDWIEQMLPESKRRPKTAAVVETKFTTTFKAAKPEPSGSADDPPSDSSA